MGGHWNLTFEQHGAWNNEAGFHRGDIGNFEAIENVHGIVKFPLVSNILAVTIPSRILLTKPLLFTKEQMIWFLNPQVLRAHG